MLSMNEIKLKLLTEICTSVEGAKKDLKKLKKTPFDFSVGKGKLTNWPVSVRWKLCTYLRLDGMRYEEIGKLYGVTRQRAYAMVRFGIEVNVDWSKWPKAENILMREMIKISRPLNTPYPVTKETVALIRAVRRVSKGFKETLVIRAQYEDEGRSLAA